MNAEHRRTYRAIFDNPIRSNVHWSDIESMLTALGAEISEGSDSAVFHRPHPRKETDKGAVVSMRRFLMEAGVKL